MTTLPTWTLIKPTNGGQGGSGSSGGGGGPSGQSKSASPCAAGAQLVNHVALDDERILTDMYEFKVELGKGSFGVVWHVTHIGTGQDYACKIINKEKVCGTYLK